MKRKSLEEPTDWAEEMEKAQRKDDVSSDSKEAVKERENEKVKKEEPSAVKRFGLFTAIEARLLSEEALEAEWAIDDELYTISYRKWKKDTMMLNRKFHRSTFSN